MVFTRNSKNFLFEFVQLIQSFDSTIVLRSTCWCKFSSLLDIVHQSDEFVLNNAENTIGVFRDDTRPMGRPSNDEQQEKTSGLEWGTNSVISSKIRDYQNHQVTMWWPDQETDITEQLIINKIQLLFINQNDINSQIRLLLTMIHPFRLFVFYIAANKICCKPWWLAKWKLCRWKEINLHMELSKLIQPILEFALALK